MNYTKNYRLPQWVKEDRIMMEDFNAAMATMESGMTSTAEATARAEQSAKNAENSAAAAAAARPYVIGYYVGTEETQTIELGFRPSFLIVSGMNESRVVNTLNDFDRYFYMSSGKTMTHRLSFTSSGFTVYPFSQGGYYYPDMAQKDRTYVYVAFK